MHVRRSTSFAEVQAPAKVNLFLEVVERRPDGFHELDTLMAPVAWYDTLTVSPRGDDLLQLTIEWAGSRGGDSAPELPVDGRNLVVRALEALRTRSGNRPGADIRLVKRIPVAAGLAGGSSDAAAALVAGNLVWQLGLSRAELVEIAAKLGSDVPFFLIGGMARARGRGERLERLDGLGPLALVIVKPPAGLATADVFRTCRPAPAPHGIGGLVEAWRQQRLLPLGRALFNGLEGAAAALSPWIERLRSEFQRLALPGCAMSGSGTSFFGVCHHLRHARQVASRLRHRGLGEVLAVGTHGWAPRLEQGLFGPSHVFPSLGAAGGSAATG